MTGVLCSLIDKSNQLCKYNEKNTQYFITAEYEKGNTAEHRLQRSLSSMVQVV